MDRIASRKLHLSPAESGIYDKANTLFDTYQNEITFMLAQEYLENGKIDPVKSVTKFLKERNVRGAKLVTDSADSGMREVYESTENIEASEDDKHYVFPCLFEVEGESVVVNIQIEKIASSSPTTEKAADEKLLSRRLQR